MKMHQKLWLSLFGAFVVAAGTPQHASAQAQNKPNILFIMGDDIGWMQPSIYHQGLMVIDPKRTSSRKVVATGPTRNPQASTSY